MQLKFVHFCGCIEYHKYECTTIYLPLLQSLHITLFPNLDYHKHSTFFNMSPGAWICPVLQVFYLGQVFSTEAYLDIWGPIILFSNELSYELQNVQLHSLALTHWIPVSLPQPPSRPDVNYQKCLQILAVVLGGGVGRDTCLS